MEENSRVFQTTLLALVREILHHSASQTLLLSYTLIVSLPSSLINYRETLRAFVFISRVRLPAFSFRLNRYIQSSLLVPIYHIIFSLIVFSSSHCMRTNREFHSARVSTHNYGSLRVWTLIIKLVDSVISIWNSCPIFQIVQRMPEVVLDLMTFLIVISP